MNNILIFTNSRFGEIRTAGTAEEPLFCLADVCKALDLRQGDVRQRLSDGVVTTQPIIDSLGREQQANFITEDGLYDVILDSRKPEAKAFRKWITSDVIPSIRKNGAYMTADTLEKALASPDFLIQLATQLKNEKEQNRQLAMRIESDKPKVDFATAVLASKGSILIGELAKILKQNGVDMGEKRLFKWMRDNHYLGSYGEYYNIPTQRYMEMGLFELKKSTHTENEVIFTTTTTKVTPKGQQYFIQKLVHNVKEPALF